MAVSTFLAGSVFIKVVGVAAIADSSCLRTVEFSAVVASFDAFVNCYSEESVIRGISNRIISVKGIDVRDKIRYIRVKISRRVLNSSRNECISFVKRI